MTIDSTDTLILDDEGRRIWPYVDTRGNRTWGIGHNLAAAPLCPAALALINQAIDTQYEFDLQQAKDAIKKLIVVALDPVREAALIDMAFNLGEENLSKFTTFLSYINLRQFSAAADDLRNNTLVYKQLPFRYGRLADMLESGQWPS